MQVDQEKEQGIEWPEPTRKVGCAERAVPAPHNPVLFWVFKWKYLVLCIFISKNYLWPETVTGGLNRLPGGWRCKCTGVENLTGVNSPNPPSTGTGLLSYTTKLRLHQRRCCSMLVAFRSRRLRRHVLRSPQRQRKPSFIQNPLDAFPRS